MKIFSVIIPTYNRSDILVKCLDRLNSQKFPLDKIEVFICDDGSTDETAAVIKEYIPHGYELIYLRQENSGPASARNMGIRKATGEYLLILNDDALLDPDALAIHYELQKQYSHDKVAILGKFSLLPEYRKDTFGYLLENSDLLFYYHRMKRMHYYNHEMFYTCNISIKRQAVIEVGMFDESFTGPAAEDLELGYRLEKIGYRVLYEPYCIAWHDHKITPDSFCRTYLTRGDGAVTMFQKHSSLNIFKNYSESRYSKLLHSLKYYENIIDSVLANVNKMNRTLCDVPDEKELYDMTKRMSKLLVGIQNYYYFTGCMRNPQFPQLLPEWKNWSERLTSIIILNLNGSNHIKQCIKSIQQYTDSPYELIVVDNGSSDCSREYLRTIPELILIENKKNVGAPYGRNQGLAIAKGKYIVFMDNDTIVTEGWLGRFIAHFKSHPRIGIIGPRSNYVSGPQLVRNVSYKNENDLQIYAKQWSERQTSKLTLAGRLILFCMIVKREVISKIGGIDPIYRKWGWEDDDYCVRAQIAGFKLGIANDVYIHHTGSQTSKTANINYRELLQENWYVFREKYGIANNKNGEMSYGREILDRPFSHEKHFIHIPPADDVESLIYNYSSGNHPVYLNDTHSLSLTELLGKVQIQEANGNYKDAASAMNIFVGKIDETTIKELKLSKYDLFMMAGILNLKSGNVRKAKEYYELSLHEKPDSPEACYSIASCFELLGQNEGAREMYGWACKLNPSWVEAKNKFISSGGSIANIENQYVGK